MNTSWSPALAIEYWKRWAQAAGPAPVLPESVGAADPGLDPAIARVVALDNFGCLDIADNGGERDGLASREDFRVAAESAVLDEKASRLVGQIARDDACFAALDGRDGTQDGLVSFYALQSSRADGDRFLGAAPREVPDEFDAHYRPDRLSALATGNSGALSLELDASALDLAQSLFNEPAADGSGSSVIDAALGTMLENYSRIDPGSASPEDKVRRDFAATLAARAALTQGVTIDAASSGVGDDLSGAAMGALVLDGGAIDAAYQRLITDKTIEADLAAQVRAATPDAALKAMQMATRIESPLYADHLRALERAGRAQEATQRVSRDLAALGLLDSAAAARASERLMENMAKILVEEGDFTNTPPEVSGLAIGDVLTTMMALKAGRVGLRITGQIATMINALDSIKAEWAAISANTSRFSQQLGALFRATQASGARIDDAFSVVRTLDAGALGGAVSASEQNILRRFIIGLDRVGAWQTGAALFGVAGGVYRLAHPGEHPWDRLYAAQEFLASASYITGPAKMLGHFLEVRAGEAPSKFNTAIRQSMVDLLSANSSVSPATEASSADALLGTTSSSGSAMSSAAAPDAKHRLAAGIVKGFAAATEVGSAVMGIALGIKQIINGVETGSAADKAIGSITLASGTATAVGATLSLAFNIGTPVLIFGGVLSLIGLAVSAATQRPFDAMLSEEFEKRWGAQGFLKPDHRAQLAAWLEEHKASDAALGIDI